MKKWKTGDKVKFLNEKGGGIIVAVKSHEEVIVQLPDGIEIPYSASELISDDKNFTLDSSSSPLQETSSTEKTNYPTKHKQQQRKYQEHIEIDLHIEELTDNPALYAPHEKLQIQLDYFEKKLYNAIANQVRKITVIHGIGNGRLKYEVREFLKNVDEVESIEDGSYKRYGFGATVVYIK